MTTSPTGLNAPPTLGGYHLTGASASEVVVRARELKTLRTAADGGTREQLAWVAAGLPLRTRKRTFTPLRAPPQHPDPSRRSRPKPAHTPSASGAEHLAWR